MFKLDVKIPAVFSEPIDLYILKKDNLLTTYQVGSSDMKVILILENDATLRDVPDYIRIARKHQFQKEISLTFADDLVLVDNEICEICQLPSLLEVTSNPTESLCYN